uniref:FBA_2 domain-containing protein n=1 Tax=Caenorhabditis tropicalis TaxID=1561998 RepID=A0A1I7T360_9PELO
MFSISQKFGLKVGKVENSKQGELQNMLDENLSFSLIDCKRVWIYQDFHPFEEKLLPFLYLKAVLKRWIDGSKMQKFWMIIFNLDAVTIIFKLLGQVFPKAGVQSKRFMIQQKKNGPKAIVFKAYNSICLDMQFELV